MQISDRIVFITGNSRSGTTLMMRLLNNHSKIHAINEPHFFESIWSGKDKGTLINKNVAGDILHQLFVRQREGFFEDPMNYPEKYSDEIQAILEEKSAWTKEEVYRSFIFFETNQNHKTIPCEKTPQNVFYIHEILELFPKSIVLNMIRDPRDVLLSQKMKWQRPKLGAGFMTKKEVRRLKINYHPITISRLWNAAIKAYQKAAKDDRVLGIKFEDLVRDTSAVLRSVCSRLEIEFEPGMLDVPFAGSSTKADSSEVGIRPKQSGGWIDKGLNPTEIDICQRTCANEMSAFGYLPVDLNSSNWKKLLYFISFPFKILMALFVNMGRMRSIKETLIKRLGLS